MGHRVIKRIFLANCRNFAAILVRRITESGKKSTMVDRVVKCRINLQRKHAKKKKKKKKR